MASILKVTYGGDTHLLTVEPFTTIGQIVNDPSTKAVLGYGDNVRALVHSIEQPLTAQIGTVSELTLETRANEKAS